MTHPDQMQRLRDNPDLMPSAVEEILRWSSPVLYFRRQATADFELRGKYIRAGDKIAMWHVSGNRDEEVFEDPFRFNAAAPPMITWLSGVVAPISALAQISLASSFA